MMCVLKITSDVSRFEAGSSDGVKHETECGQESKQPAALENAEGLLSRADLADFYRQKIAEEKNDLT
jgi:hypothetical protein